MLTLGGPSHAHVHAGTREVAAQSLTVLYLYMRISMLVLHLYCNMMYLYWIYILNHFCSTAFRICVEASTAANSSEVRRQYPVSFVCLEISKWEA